MKKIILSLSVVVVFALYSLGLRHHNNSINIPKPASLTKNQTSSSSTNSVSTNTPSSTTNTNTTVSSYKDGTYTGSVVNAYYGNVQVEATIKNGQITKVQFLEYPNTHSTSVSINTQAMPYLQQEAIQSQSSNVNIITGATFTSQAFIQSLASALALSQ